MKLDERFFLWLNGLHTSWLDPVMSFLTKTEVWIPLYLLLIYLIIKQYKWHSWALLLGLIIVVVIADEITVGIMKPYFERLRPSHEPSLANVIHLVDNETGGLYGFASSHAANTFGVAMFVWLALRKHNKWIWLIFGWSTVMSYSRIYLGLHYPGDIFVGLCIGLLIGWLLSKIIEKLLGEKAPQLPTQ